MSHNFRQEIRTTTGLKQNIDQTNQPPPATEAMFNLTNEWTIMLYEATLAKSQMDSFCGVKSHLTATTQSSMSIAIPAWWSGAQQVLEAYPYVMWPLTREIKQSGPHPHNWQYQKTKLQPVLSWSMLMETDCQFQQIMGFNRLFLLLSPRVSVFSFSSGQTSPISLFLNIHLLIRFTCANIFTFC